MKILHLSDLHRIIDPYYYPKRLFEQNRQADLIKDILNANKIDVVAVTGDIFEDWNYFYYKHRHIIDQVTSPYIKLHDLFGDIPVVFCLGNHEFAHHSIPNTIESYSNCKQVKNIHCLDICNRVVIDGVNFVGNVLWYDGRCSQFREDGEQLCKHIDETWLDSTIEQFDPIKENQKNVQNIKNNIEEGMINILLTHTVPHWKLNEFNHTEPMGIYNTYSGMNDLFNDYDVYVDYALCGHTHRQSRLEIFHKNSERFIQCYNVGSDYNHLKWNFIDVEQDQSFDWDQSRNDSQINDISESF